MTRDGRLSGGSPWWSCFDCLTTTCLAATSAVECDVAPFEIAGRTTTTRTPQRRHRRHDVELEDRCPSCGWATLHDVTGRRRPHSCPELTRSEVSKLYPSVDWGVEEWYQAMRVDNGLFERILDGIFLTTRHHYRSVVRGG